MFSDNLVFLVISEKKNTNVMEATIGEPFMCLFEYTRIHFNPCVLEWDVNFPPQLTLTHVD